MDTRKAFKIFNIVILVYYGIVGIVTVVRALGIGSEVAETSSGRGFLTAAVTVVALIPIILVIFMAREGLRENYELCAKIALAVVIFDIVGMLMSSNFSFGSIIAVILGIIYVFMAKTLE